MMILNLIVVIVGVLSLVLLIVLRVTKLMDWNVHHTMVDAHAKAINGTIVKGNFNDFHREMEKQTWGRNEAFPESFFTSLDNEKAQREVDNAYSNEEAARMVLEFNEKVNSYKQNYIHAEIICFNGVCMKLDYKSYKKYRQFLKYHRTEEETYDWNLNDNE